MSIDIFSSTNVMLRCFLLSLINLILEEIYRNKLVVQTPIIYFINQKENHVFDRHNSILTLIKLLLFDFLITIIHHFVLFFRILSRKKKFYVKRKKQYSVNLHYFFFVFYVGWKLPHYSYNLMK